MKYKYLGIRKKKADVWVSVILYTLIAIVSIVFILQAGTPLMEGMQDRSVFQKMKSQMLQLDQHVKTVASEGQGSQRTMSFDVPTGDIIIDDDGFRWQMETDAKIVEPRSSTTEGGLVISANSDIKVTEYDGFYMIRNTYLEINLTKNGTQSVPVSLNTSSLVNSIRILEDDILVTEGFTFMVAGDADSVTGTGYTEVSSKGSMLGSVSYIAHMETTNFNYDLVLILDGQSDYLRTEIKNFVPK